MMLTGCTARFISKLNVLLLNADGGEEGMLVLSLMYQSVYGWYTRYLSTQARPWVGRKNKMFSCLLACLTLGLCSFLDVVSFLDIGTGVKREGGMVVDDGFSCCAFMRVERVLRCLDLSACIVSRSRWKN